VLEEQQSLHLVLFGNDHFHLYYSLNFDVSFDFYLLSFWKHSFVYEETIQCRSTSTSGQILIPHYNATTLSLRHFLGDKIDSTIHQKKQIRPNGLAESSTVLFQNFDDQLWNWSTIELPRNGDKRKCKLLKSCQENASTKTGQKGWARKCLETAR
jgi:hypothetical protein